MTRNKHHMNSSSVGQYATVRDAISDLNVMIVESPIGLDARRQLAEVVAILEADEQRRANEK